MSSLQADRLVQGQSLSTIDKERRIAAALSINRNIVRLKCPNETYYHLDLNAGSGFNEKFDVIGSPLVFVHLWEKACLPYEAFFWDRDKEAIEALKGRLRSRSNCHFFAQDNSDFSTVIRSSLKPHSLGSVLIDPNGWLLRNKRTGAGPPSIEELAYFFHHHRRMDFIANLNFRIYQMMRGNEKKEVSPINYGLLYGIQDFGRLFNKKHWLINHHGSGHSRFVRLIGRNLSGQRDYRAQGWYHLDSKEGREILQWIERGVKEGEVEL